jgi:hypothetical protein
MTAVSAMMDYLQVEDAHTSAYRSGGSCSRGVARASGMPTGRAAVHGWHRRRGPGAHPVIIDALRRRRTG